MAGATAETITTVAERIARAPLPRAERGELTSLLAILAGLRVPRPRVDELLRRNPMLRDLLKESVTIEILRDEFREEFMAEGRREAMRETMQIVLEGRFGELEPAERAALRAAEEPVLRALAAHVATDSREQMRARLGLA